MFVQYKILYVKYRHLSSARQKKAGWCCGSGGKHAVVKTEDAIAHIGYAMVMRGDKHRHSAAREAAENVHDLFGAGAVQRCGGLVGNKQVGNIGNGAGYGNALLLTA